MLKFTHPFLAALATSGVALAVCSCSGGGPVATSSGSATSTATSAGLVSVSGARLLRDGQPWIPHGFYQTAFESTPTYPDITPFFLTAYQNYTPQEYTDMRNAGADSVRIQVSQPGMDPDNTPLFSTQFHDTVLSAIAAARAAGLTAIVSLQDEVPQSGETAKNYSPLPDERTQRVWKQIVPSFKNDKGVVFELYNEPQPNGDYTSAATWNAWTAAMNTTIQTIRSLGGVNVVLADGTHSAQYLTGAPALTDPLDQVAYAAHPYANQPSDAVNTVWDVKFGNFSATHPTLISEWGTGYDKVNGLCDPSTAYTSTTFFQYLQQHGVGLEIGAWDWGAASFGTARYNFPPGSVTTYLDASGNVTTCQKNAAFGPGKTVEVWYMTGTPAGSPQ